MTTYYGLYKETSVSYWDWRHLCYCYSGLDLFFDNHPVWNQCYQPLLYKFLIVEPRVKWDVPSSHGALRYWLHFSISIHCSRRRPGLFRKRQIWGCIRYTLDFISRLCSKEFLRAMLQPYLTAVKNFAYSFRSRWWRRWSHTSRLSDLRLSFKKKACTLVRRRHVLYCCVVLTLKKGGGKCQEIFGTLLGGPFVESVQTTHPVIGDHKGWVWDGVGWIEDVCFR